MLKMTISFDPEITPLFPIINEYNCAHLFSLENENSHNYYPNKEYLFDRFNENENGIDIPFFSINENSVESNQRTGYFFKGEISNLNQSCSIPLFTNKINSITVKETNSTDLDTHKTKAKQLFQIKMEISQITEGIKSKTEELPKYFSENSINVIFKQFDISKEMKSNILFDNQIKIKKIEKIKEVLESNDGRKRRKKGMIFPIDLIIHLNILLIIIN